MWAEMESVRQTVKHGLKQVFCHGTCAILSVHVQISERLMQCPPCPILCRGDPCKIVPVLAGACWLLQAQEEALRQRETPVSSAIVAAGSAWKAQLRVGSILFDLGTWDSNTGRERAEKVLSK